MRDARVIVIDDDIAVREAFLALLSESYQVKCFDSAESFLAAYKDFEFEDNIPSCILLDFQLPGMTGVELQTSLKTLNAQFPIAFMSGNAHPTDVIDAWNGGAIKFLLKPFTAPQISNVLDELFLIAAKRLEFEESNALESNIITQPINQREAQVLYLLGSGLQQVEVAKILGLSLRTVKMYRATLKEKLNLNTLMDLARYCDKHIKTIQKIAGIK